MLRNNYKSWVRSPTGPSRCSTCRKMARHTLGLREKPALFHLKERKKNILALSFLSKCFSYCSSLGFFWSFKCQTVHLILFLDLLCWRILKFLFLWAPLWIVCHSYVVIQCGVLDWGTGSKPSVRRQAAKGAFKESYLLLSLIALDLGPPSKVRQNGGKMWWAITWNW